MPQPGQQKIPKSRPGRPRASGACHSSSCCVIITRAFLSVAQRLQALPGHPLGGGAIHPAVILNNRGAFFPPFALVSGELGEAASRLLSLGFHPACLSLW